MYCIDVQGGDKKGTNRLSPISNHHHLSSNLSLSLSQGVPLMFPPLAAGGHGTPIALANFLRHLSIAYGDPNGSGAITHSTARQMLGERRKERWKLKPVHPCARPPVHPSLCTRTFSPFMPGTHDAGGSICRYLSLSANLARLRTAKRVF